jgi:hypothetical protein
MYYKIIDEKTIFSDGKFLKTEITENGKTRKVNIINPTEEQMLNAGWQIWVDPEPSDEEKLRVTKDQKLVQIANYDASPSVEEFTISGVPMWLGHELRQQIRTSADAYTAMGYENMTKVFNGQEFTFPITTWLQMLNALEIYAAEALNTTERHKNAVMDMDNIQDVTDYDYTTGYPEKLEF